MSPAFYILHGGAYASSISTAWHMHSRDLQEGDKMKHDSFQAGGEGMTEKTGGFLLPPRRRHVVACSQHRQKGRPQAGTQSRRSQEEEEHRQVEQGGTDRSPP